MLLGYSAVLFRFAIYMLEPIMKTKKLTYYSFKLCIPKSFTYFFFTFHLVPNNPILFCAGDKAI